MKRIWTWSFLAAWAAVQALGCSSGGSASALASTAAPVDAAAAASVDLPPRLKAGVAELAPEKIKITSQPTGQGGKGFIFLVGENHASAKTQIDIADMSMKLLAANAIDAILLEGTNGPVELKVENEVVTGQIAERFLQRMSVSKESLHAYWREQLQWGQIAAYEYVKFIRPETPLWGVEDMVAKARFAVKGLAPGEDDVKRQREADDRALALVDGAVDQLAAKVGADTLASLNTLRAAYDAAAAAARKAHTDYVAASQPGDERVALEVERAGLSARFRRVQPIVENIQPIHEEYSAKLKAYREKLRPHEAYLSNVQSLVSRAERGDHAALARLQTLKSALQRLEPEKKALDGMREKLDKFDRDHGKELQEIQESAKRIGERVKELDAPRLRAAEALAEKLDAKQSAFFGVANALRDAGEPHGLRFDGVESYYRDEAERARKAAEGDGLDLDERDAAMVKNTEAYFQENASVKSAVLIVGYAHLEGMTRRLRAAGFDVVAGKMTAADAELEPWEEDEWAQRETAYDRFFSRMRMNPLPRMENPDWVREQISMVRSLPELGKVGSGYQETDGLLAGGAKLYVRDDGKASVFVTAAPRNPQVQRGGHRARLGPVPGLPNHHFEAFDRERAIEEVKGLSGGTTAFAHYYKDRGKYVMQTPKGPVDLKTFEASVPVLPDGTKPKRVILSGEPDEVQRDGARVSPLWEHMRQSAGGGGGKEPPKGPRWTEAYDAPPPGGPRNPKGPGAQRRAGSPRVQVLMTLNMARAKKNAAYLDEHPAKGPIAFVDQGGLDQLRFTGPNGENAQTVVIVAKNVPEFQAAIKRAAAARKLENKQVALVTCGDAFEATAELREMLLNSGARMVWVPDRQVTPEAAAKLVGYLKRSTAGMAPDQPRADISELVGDTLGLWHSESPVDPDLAAFRTAKGFVLLQEPGGLWLRGDRSDWTGAGAGRGRGA